MSLSRDQSLEALYARFIWANIFLAATGKAQPTLEDENDIVSVSSEDSCRVDLLHESSDSRKRGRMLDALAQLLSYKRGWRHVTATAVEIRADKHLQFRISRNGAQSRREIERDQTFLDALRDFLLDLAGSDVTADVASQRFLPVAIKFCEERHADNKRDLQKLLENVTAGHGKLPRQGSSQSSPPALLCVRELQRLLADSDRQSSAERSQADVVTYAFGKLKTTEAERLCTYASFPKEALHMLRMLARPLSNLIVMAKVFRSLYLHRTVDFIFLRAPKPWHLPRDYIVSADQAWELLNLPNKELQKSSVLLRDAGKPFEDVCSASMPVHAEFQLVSFYSSHPEDCPLDGYLGCSKKSCVICTNAMIRGNQGLSTKQSHHRIHPRWMVPIDQMDQYAEFARAATDWTIKRIKMHVTSPIHNTNLHFGKQSTGTMTATILEESLDNIWIESRRQTERSEEAAQRDLLEIESDAVDDSHSRCCNTDCIVMASERCSRCKDSHYCSEDCQRSDWPLHRQVCRRWSEIKEAIPGASLLLRLDPNRKRIKVLAVFDVIDSTSSFTHKQCVTKNLKHGHALENHIMILSGSRPTYRQFSHVDSHNTPLAQNRALAHLVSLMNEKEKPGALWSGPVIAVWYRSDTVASPNVVNFQPRFLRHLRDFFVEFGNENVDRPFADGRQTVIGMKMTCKGENSRHKTDFFEPVNIPLDHPIWLTDPTPVSARVGFPIKVRRYLTEGDTAGSEDPENQAITFLHTNITDHEEEVLGYGFAPWEWQNFVGTALLAREDRERLTQKDLEAQCDFCQYYLGTRFQYAAESGDRGPVEDAMTPASYEDFCLHHKTRATGNLKTPYPTDDEEAFWTPERLDAHNRQAVRQTENAVVPY